MWRYLILVIICLGLGYLWNSRAGKTREISSSDSGAFLETNISSQNKQLATAGSPEQEERVQRQDAVSAQQALRPAAQTGNESPGGNSSPKASAALYIQVVDRCAQMLGLPEGTDGQSAAVWTQPKNQEALKDCMAKEGLNPRGVQEDKKRDLAELSACVKNQTGAVLPEFKQWINLPADIKTATLGCRSVLKGWVLQSQLNRLLGVKD